MQKIFLLIIACTSSFPMQPDLPMKVDQNLEGVSFATGYRILEEKNGVAIVGMSPGNSYFKREVIANLLQTVQAYFSKIYIVVPDRPSIHTYTALGYSHDEAERLIRKPVKRTMTRIQQGLAILAQTHDTSMIHVLDWKSEIESSPVYQEKLEYMKALFKSNAEFRQDINQAATPILAPAALKKGIALSEDVYDESAHYILKEFAFLLASPSILKSDAIGSIYHSKWPMWNNFASGYYDDNVSVVGDVIIS